MTGYDDLPGDIEDYAPSLSLSQAHSLAQYLNSRKFESVCVELSSLWVTKNTGGDKYSAIEGRLRGDIAVALAGFQIEDCRNIASAIFSNLERAIGQQMEQIFQTGSDLDADARASVVRNSAAVASNVIRNDLNQSREEIDSDVSFINECLESALHLLGRARMPHGGDVRQIQLSDIYVAPNTLNREGHGQEALSAISQKHRAVILGDPGGGKTTTATRIAHLLSHYQHDSKQKEIIPLIVTLRDWSGELVSDKTPLPKIAEKICDSQYSVTPKENQVERLLRNGEILVVFDGLDELLEASHRKNIAERIETLALQYPLCPIIVTCRRVEYQECSLARDIFEKVELDAFTTEMQEEYAEKWFALDDSLSSQDRKALQEGLFRDTRSIDDVARNPLMLSLLCHLYAYERYVPENRADLYRKCAELLFVAWDKTRGIKPSTVFDATLQSSLEYIAYKMLKTGVANEGMRQEKIRAILCERLHGRSFDTEDEALNAADKFLDFCKGRAWILTEVSPERFAFVHNTFLEYFAARYIVKSKSTAKSLAAEIQKRVAKNQWDTVCQIALQDVNDKIDDGSEKTLRHLLKIDTESPVQDELVIRFARRCLDFHAPSTSTMQVIARRSVMHLERRTSGDVLRLHTHLLDSSERIQERWLNTLRSELSDELIARQAPDSWVANLIFPHGLLHFTEGNSPRALKAWRTIVDDLHPLGIEKFAATQPWILLGIRSPKELVRQLVDYAGTSALFMSHPMPNGASLISICDRVCFSLNNPNKRDSMFVDELCQSFAMNVTEALSRGEILRRPRALHVGAAGIQAGFLGWNIHRQSALLISQLAYWEIRNHEAPRNEVLNTLSQEGLVTSDNRALLGLDELNIYDDLRPHVRSWLSGTLDLFSPAVTEK